ncbi:MAG: hypothetical protein ABIH67_00515 [Candidatus Uhrbacteria bacterium]
MPDDLKHPVVKTYFAYIYLPGALVTTHPVYELDKLDNQVNYWIKDMISKHGGSVQVIPLPPKAMIAPLTNLALFLHQTTIIWTPSPDSTR